MDEDRLDKLDDFELPVTKSCPNLTKDRALPSTLDNLRALEGKNIDEDDPLPSLIAISPHLRKKPKKRKRRKMNDGGPSSSSSSDDAAPSHDSTMSNDQNSMTDQCPVSVLLQDNDDGELTEEGIKEILDRNIVVPQAAADSFRRTRGAMVAEAKGQVCSKHLQAMSEGNRLPRWAWRVPLHMHQQVVKCMKNSSRWCDIRPEKE